MTPWERALRTALGLLAGAVTALLFWNTLDTPFLSDDRKTILLNPSLVDPWNLAGVVTYNLARPVANLSFAGDRIAWGLSSFGYHVTSAVLHVACVALFYGWCTRALSDESGRTRHLGTLGPEWAAFFAAAAFGLHPVIASSVLYLSARSEILCAIASLAALTFARRAIVASSRTAGLIALVFGGTAIGSSSAATGLPLVVLAYDAWVLRDDGWRRRTWRIYLPSMAVVLLAAWMATFGTHVEPVQPHSLASYVLGEAAVQWRYAGLLTAPRGQALVHQVWWPAPWSAAGIALLVLLIGAMLAAYRARRAHPLVTFGVLWFVLAIASTALALARDGMAEWRLYAAAPGLLLAAASVLAAPLASRRTARAIATVAIAAFAVLTYARNTRWSDPMTMWEEAVRRSPAAWQAHLGYADLLREIDRCDRAAAEYREALRLYPDQPDARAGLAACR